MNDDMIDYSLGYDGARRRMLLRRNDSSAVLEYDLADDEGLLSLRGVVGGDSIHMRVRRIDLRALPLLGPSFHWTIDGYR